MDTKKPKVITMCGSARFKEEHLREIKRLTLEGNVVLSCSFDIKSDIIPVEITEIYTQALEYLHLQKIDMSDAIFVVNPGNYIGPSTYKEIQYAKQNGKQIIYLESE